MSSESYYVPVGSESLSAAASDPDRKVTVGRFASTDLTISVWADTMQHGAPPSALLVRALERCGARNDVRVTRVAVDILGPIPIAELEVRSWVQRPGRRVELVVAELWAADAAGRSRAVARATGWRMETVDTRDTVHTADAPLPPRTAGREGAVWTFPGSGYLDTLEYRWIAEIGGDGPAAVWAKPKPALVRGEQMTPLERLFSVADIANGVGSKLDPTHWTFLNTDLTVHVFRVPEGEWVGVSAETSIGPDGVGMCAGVLYDDAGAIGRIAQSVQVRARP
ncbi:thioesterase family protein [Rhodococcus tibetensis]|uniref:Thioesterase family protein n=1 Tax=Rhodococcus tibetensis TaxID=2965064 RepID=A0ABT1QCU1_9NOCA|nr:thioesterase family protein [Rhodococcus sp. FXJ9.536]MCQ4120081.1 thioesterase family protein [Rhodococcus sp. FXJ9.536]